MRKVFLLIVLPCLLFVSVDINAQEWKWARKVNISEGGNYCAVDISGNVYAAGSWGPGANILKYDSLGNLLWSLGTTGGTNVGAVGLTTDGFGNEFLMGVYDTTLSFGGHTLTSPGPRKYYFFIAKISSAGVVDWIKGVGNVASMYIYGSSSWIATDRSGNVYITCSFSNNATIGSYSIANSNTDGSSDILVAKFDSSGTNIWAKSYGGKNSEWPFGFTVTQNNNIYLDGYCIPSDTLSFGTTSLSDTGSYTLGFLAKLDSNGNAIWAHGIKGSLLTGLTTNANEDLFITGGYAGGTLILGSDSLPYPSTIYYYGLLAKFDSSGTVSWAKAMRGNYVMPMSSTIDPCGNVWIISMMGEGDLMTNDTIDGHILVPPASNGIPNFIACWTGTGSFITAVAIGSGGDDPNLIASDKCGNIYISSDVEFCDTLIIAGDTITTHSETQFVAKYNPNLGCGSCGVGDHTTAQIDPKQNSIITLYPNPAFNECTISYTGILSENASITIYDITGRLIHTCPLTGTNTIISTANLPPGMYQCRIDVDGNGIVSKKLVVIK